MGSSGIRRKRLVQVSRGADAALRRAAASGVEVLENRLLLAAISEQIIVDQFGWQASAADKTVIFADPVNGQNSAISYTPGATFQVRRVSDNVSVFTGSTVAWNGGAVQPQSGDRVWWGDFSSLVTPGNYYIYDPANDLRSYSFVLDDGVYDPVLETAVRMFYYQRCGTAITAQYGGNWVHNVCHEGAGQDLAALEWLNGAAVPGTARDVHGGWHDAGDMNKYVPFTGGTIWDLLQAYEWNPGAFGDNWNIPESGNGVPDILDEVKYELDWQLRMQTTNGSVLNRVCVQQYTNNSPPEAETIPRYYTQPTSWATSTAVANFAHASRMFASFGTAYAGYAATLLTAAQNGWNWLNTNTSMTPASGTDGGTLAAAAAGSDAGADKRLRVLASAELFKTTGTAAYRTYFDTWVKDASTNDGTHNPLNANWFDATQSPEMNRACVTYASTAGATAALVSEIKTDLAGSLNSYLNGFNGGNDAYRAYVYDGHYCWGSNQIKAQWANLFLYGIELNVSPANSSAYRDVAEEYLHYFHGRNPLSWVYLSNTGAKGANIGADKPVMEFYHGWFNDGTIYDGANSTFGPAPGYLVGGPNQFYTGGVTPPTGEPPMKAYRDWNTGYPEQSWEVTEPAIYYQAAYTLLASQFATGAVAQVAAPGLSPAPGTYSSAQSVTISTTTPGATIRYTTDGSTPTPTHGTIYGGSAIPISATTILNAIAYADGLLDSAVSGGTYTIGTVGQRIYDDALAADWSDWSWNATLDFANAPPVESGTASISAVFTAGWASLSLDKGTAIDAAGYLSLDFDVHGGTSGNKSLQFYSQATDNSTGDPTVAFTAMANTWTHVSIPLSSLGNPAQIKRINFQNATANAMSAVYFDNIQLVAEVVNHAPTDISLTPMAVGADLPAGAVVGSLSTTDEDAGDTFTYSLVSGTGSTGNDSFTITNNQLLTAAIFEVATQSSYSIRVRSTDAGGLSFEKVFTISVVADQTPPVVSLISAPNLSWRDLGKSFSDVVVRFQDANLDLASIGGDEITVTGPGGPLVVTLVGTTAGAGTLDATYRLTPPGGSWTGDDDGTYTLTAPAGRFADLAGNPNALTNLGTFTAAVSVSGPTLYVNGTAGADTISIAIQDVFYQVTLNGVETWYSGSQVSGINVRGFAGNDRITIGPEIMGVSIDGGTGDDSITGGDGNDSIRGDAGNDTIIGGLGDDTITGNTEDDSIIGGAGADSIMAGLGADTVDGGAGNDILLAGDGRDLVLGGDGDDYIEGRGKMDTIYAGTGNDTIYGGAGSDLIYGEDGDDWVDVGVSTIFHDTVDGGAGSDLIRSDSDDVLSNCEGVWPM